MKRNVGLLLAAVLLLGLLAGCAGSADGPATPTPSVPVESTAPRPETGGTPDVDVDVDLTVLSSTMVYAEVYNMMVGPEDYLDKTIKIKGKYAVYHNETADEHYHAVLITDALACCAEGLEFIWNGEHVYPDDYPEEGAEIEITGTFHIGYDGEFRYVYIETNEIC